MTAIAYRGFGFAYPGPRGRAPGPWALQGVDLEVAEGEFVVVAGSSGSGKSTLLRAANGLVPHGTGGTFAGSVEAFGRSTHDHPPRALADVVGFVHQDPEAQFVVDEVEADLAFVLENLGTPEPDMRRRVEEVMDALDIARLRHRSPATLSGGERQRCAIAGALAAGPAALVLDEPTSQLDPQGAEDLLGAVGRLNSDLGTTVLISEHRLDRVAAMADRLAVVEAGRVARVGPPAEVLSGYPGAPAVTRLGTLLGWDPAPLTVREARRHPVPPLGPPPPPPPRPAPGEVLCRARDLEAVAGGVAVLHPVDLEVARGEVVALLGRNGSGKTTLLLTLAGLRPPGRGQVARPGSSAYVPQDPTSLLFAPTVRRELEQTLRLLGRPDRGEVERWLALLGLDQVAGRHPRSLSGGQRQRVAVAAVAVGGADLLLLDEPTRGMDARSRSALEAALAGHASAGGAAVVATHDVELAARCATRVVVLGGGGVVADGPAATVLAGSLFAPQVLRVLPPYLTVEQVASVLAGSDR